VNSSVRAISADSAGIGSGSFIRNGSSIAERVRIANGNVTAISFNASGVGFAENYSVLNEIVFSRTVRLESLSQVGHVAIAARSTALSNASLFVSSRDSPAFLYSPTAIGSADLTIAYRNVTHEVLEPLAGIGSPVLQVGSVTVPIPFVWSLCLSTETTSRCFEVDFAETKSFLASVPSFGIYEIYASCGDQFGRLVTAERSSFLVNLSALFVPEVHFLVAATRSPTVLPRTIEPSHPGKWSLGIILAVSAAGLVVVITMLLVVILALKRRKKADEPLQSSGVVSGYTDGEKFL
jgi:hypothetical protein